jgi:hypothetical protein
MMSMKLRKLFVALLFGALSAVPAAAEEGLVGAPAPVFSLADQDGKLVDYEDAFYGKHHLILTFFPAAFTPV